MRVLLTTTGYPGHLLPLVPFARECVRAGHRGRRAPRDRRPGARGSRALIAATGIRPAAREPAHTASPSASVDAVARAGHGIARSSPSGLPAGAHCA
jgi:hypothetical protein